MNRFCWLIGLPLLMLAGHVAPAPIALRPEPMPFTPTQFYIANVVDARPSRGPFARLLTDPARPAEAVDLQGGTGPAIERFLQQSLPTKRSLRPVVIHVTECRLTETAGATGRVLGRLALRLSFRYRREDEDVVLLDLSNNASYNRPVGQLTAPESALRQALVGTLVQFNNWINREAPRDERLATRLTVLFTDVTTPTDATSDTVFYNVARPLTWDDFRGQKSRASRYAASVFSSFGYEGQSNVVNGVITVRLTLKVYMLKSSSWVTEPALNPYSLNHEQRHFDVARIAAERFKRRVAPDSLSLTDYNSQIQYQFIESFRDMNRIQDAYDDATNHGLNVVAQERWNARIDDELRIFGVKK